MTPNQAAAGQLRNLLDIPWSPKTRDAIKLAIAVLSPTPCVKVKIEKHQKKSRRESPLHASIQKG